MENKDILVLLPMIILRMITISIGILIRVITIRRNKSCSEQVIGRVIRYEFKGKGRMHPVVEFETGGRTYLTKKKFNLVKSISVGFLFSTQSNAYEDDNGNLCVKTGPFASLRELAEKLWPIGKEMTVYYNPQNPKINYVERPVTNRFLTIMSGFMGTLIILLALVIYFVN